MRTYLKRLGLVATLIILATACGSNEPETVVPTASPSTAAAQPTAAPTAAPAPTEDLAAVDTPRLEPLDECFAVPPDDLPFDLNAEIDCGYVIVPEFHAQPGDRTLKIGYTRLNARQDKGAAPLFMLGGGPGQDMMNKDIFLYFTPQELGSILDTRDVVILNQRGVKHTEPFLDCPAYHALKWTAVEQGTAPPALLGETLRNCVEELESQGVNFDAFNSVEIAADVNAAREALGYDHIAYYGASYGAQLGQHVMRDFPDMLESVVLDGANSLSRRSWVEDRALDAQWGLDNLIALCEADQACREAYDIQAIVDGAFALLDDDPLTFTYTDPEDPALTFDVEVTKVDLANLINTQFGSSTFVVGIPYLLTQFASDRETLTEVLGTEAGKHAVASRNATEGSLATLMHYAVVCSDDPVGSVEDLMVDETVGEFARQLGESFAQEYATACDALDVQPLPDSTDVDVTADIPTLILAGALDTRTPSYRSQIVADALPNDTFVTLSGRTHVQIDGANVCAGQIMTQFVSDPSRPPDTSCAEEAAPYPFLIPDSVPADDAIEDDAGDQPAFASGKFWQWTSFLDPVNGETTIDDEQPYSFTLTDDGLAILSGKCLAAVGSYERDDAAQTLSLTYDVPEVTDESCEMGPNEERFFPLMLGAARYYNEDGRLYVELKVDGGTLVFDLLEDRSAEAQAQTVTAVDLCGDGALTLNEVEATLDPTQISILDSNLQTLVTEASEIKPPAPGAAILMISPEGRYFKSAGVADVATCAPLPADALFEIGSNTKMMTAAIIYQLQEEGVLSTSDLIGKWVPEMAAIVPNAEQITIDMLLTHTSGIYDYLNGTFNDGPLAAGATDREVLTAAYTPEELVELAVTSGEPYFVPGEEGQWKYSNTGYILLGMIIESATGQSYARNLQDRIFDPLALSNTYLENGQPEAGVLPTGYLEPPFEYTTTEWNLSQGWSAGGVISNAEDMAVFMKALFSGDLFQDPETLALMLQPAQPDPTSPSNFYYGHGMINKYGLLGHGGQALGYQSDMGYLPDEDITIVVWTNSAENTAGAATVLVAQSLGLINTGQ